MALLTRSGAGAPGPAGVLAGPPRPGSRPIRWILSGLLAAVVLGGCDERDRTNPLDPENPDTGGVPDWLRATADHRAVDLRWEAPPTGGLERVELLRSVDGAAPEVVSTTDDPAVTTFRDSTVNNGDSLAYRLDLVRADGSRLSLPEKVAIPGPTVPWILTNTPFGLVRATPDARGTRVRGGTTGTLFDAATTPDGTSLWAVDFYGDALLHFDVDGRVVTRIPVDLPYRMALDHERELVWTGSWALGLLPVVRAFRYDGIEVERFELTGEIRDLTVDPATGVCYVARGTAGGVTRLAVGASPLEADVEATVMLVATTGGGRLVALNPIDDELHLLDAGDLSVVDVVPLDETPLAVTTAEDGVWVAEGAAAFVHRDEDLGVVETLEGMTGVADIAVDPSSGSLWVAAPGAGRITRIDLASGVRTVLPLFEPFRVTVGSAEATSRSR